MMHLTKLIFLVSALLLLASCQSSKTAYGNSYYFKATPRPASASVAEVPNDLLVSAQPIATSAVPAKQPEVLNKVINNTIQTEKNASTRKERRAVRKAFRTQLKQWLKAPQEKMQPQASTELRGFSRVGVIVGAAGLVMLVIGLIASGGGAFLVSLGGILLAVGVVFLLIDIL